jgi:hypothetical protein
METVTSFRASAVPPAELRGIISDYLELERARTFRRLLVVRFGLLTLVATAAGIWHWLSPVESSVGTAVFLVPPAWAYVVEWRRARQLAARLDEVPDAVTHDVRSDSVRKKVVKSS